MASLHPAKKFPVIEDSVVHHRIRCDAHSVRLPHPRRYDRQNAPFDLGSAALYGYSVPDIVSVTGSVQGTRSVITIQFVAPVTLGGPPTGSQQFPPDGLWAFIFMRTAAGTPVLPEYPIGISFADYFPFGDPGVFSFDSVLYVYYGQGYFVSMAGQAAEVKLGAIGNTLTLSVPTAALNLSGTTAIAFVGNPLEVTDVAPNNGLIRLRP